MLQSLATQLALATMVLVCGYAIIAGSWRERLGGVVYLAGYAMQIGFGMISTRYPALYLTVADVLLLPGFLIINRKSPHPWTLWALVVQLLSASLDIAVLVFHVVRPWLYLTIQTLAGYLVLLCLLIGTLAAHARRRRERAEA